MFELFDHTADLGIRVRAATLDELFVDAAAALTYCLVGNPDSVRPLEEITCQLESPDREYLYFDWLNDLLYRFDAQAFVVADCDVTIDGLKLRATLRGESFDPKRHEYSHEVKAITYHGLRVEQTGDQWLAEVIIDI